VDVDRRHERVDDTHREDEPEVPKRGQQCERQHAEADGRRDRTAHQRAAGAGDGPPQRLIYAPSVLSFVPVALADVNAVVDADPDRNTAHHRGDDADRDVEECHRSEQPDGAQKDRHERRRTERVGRRS